MSTIPISELPSVSTLTGAALLPVVQSGVTQQTTIAAIMNQATAYAPSGTGATNRTPQSKIRELGISVVDYGAVGDGNTDDRPSFVNAITAANGRKVLVPRPSSSYKIGSSLALSSSDRLYVEEGQSFTTNTPTGGTFEYELANPTTTPGSLMRLERLWESSPNGHSLTQEASIWAGKVETFFGVSKEFVSTNGQAGFPCVSLWAVAQNTSSPADVVALVGEGVARTSNGAVWGCNLIVRTENGISTPKLIGLEIDIDPATGVTPDANSGGIFVNAFNSAIGGPLFQTGGVNGGTFANGILFAGGIASTGSCVAMVSGTVDTFINTSGGSFNTSAILLGNTHRVRFSGTASTHAYIYNDSSNNVRCVLGSGSWIFRDSTDASSIAFFDSGGNLNLSSTASIFWDAAQSTATAGAGGAALPASPQGFITIKVGGTARKIPYYPVS